MAAAALGSVAQAQSPSEVDFGSTEYEVSFGQYVAFTMEATVSEAPERVWFVYRLNDERADNVSAATFSGDGNLTVEYLWELYPGDMPPGATVYYRWAVQTADGAWVESDESSFTYDDTRFDWQALEQAPLTVYYYKGRNLAEGVLEAGTAALARLSEEMGLQSQDPISIYVYANESDMSLALPYSSQTYDEATVTLGMTMDDKTLLLLGTGSDAQQTAAHELSHIVVGRITDNPFNDLPRWLDEGLAMYAEGDLAANNREPLEDAIANGTLLSLRSMTSYPGDPGLVDLFYGEAYSLAAYMLQTYSPDQMRELLALLGEGESLKAALQSVYQVTLDDIESGWRASVGAAANTTGGEEQAPPNTPEAVRGGIQHDSAAAAATPWAGRDGQASLPWPSGQDEGTALLAA